MLPLLLYFFKLSTCSLSPCLLIVTTAFSPSDLYSGYIHSIFFYPETIRFPANGQDFYESIRTSLSTTKPREKRWFNRQYIFIFECYQSPEVTDEHLFSIVSVTKNKDNSTHNTPDSSCLCLHFISYHFRMWIALFLP